MGFGSLIRDFDLKIQTSMNLPDTEISFRKSLLHESECNEEGEQTKSCNWRIEEI